MLTRPGIDSHLPALPVRVGQLIVTFGLAELSWRWGETEHIHQRPSADRLGILCQQPIAEGIVRWPQAELIDWDAIAHTRQNGSSQRPSAFSLWL